MPKKAAGKLFTPPKRIRAPRPNRSRRKQVPIPTVSFDDWTKRNFRILRSLLSQLFITCFSNVFSVHTLNDSSSDSSVSVNNVSWSSSLTIWSGRELNCESLLWLSVLQNDCSTGNSSIHEDESDITNALNSPSLSQFGSEVSICYTVNWLKFVHSVKYFFNINLVFLGRFAFIWKWNSISWLHQHLWCK